MGKIIITKFPYECTIKENMRTFVPTMIDYENQMVWWQQGQASENGEWISFEDVIFTKIYTFNELSGVDKPTIEEFVDECMDIIYLIGKKEDGRYSLSLTEALEAFKEIYNLNFNRI